MNPILFFLINYYYVNHSINKHYLCYGMSWPTLFKLLLPGISSLLPSGMTTSGFVEVLLFIIILIMVSPLTDVQASLGSIHCRKRNKKNNGCNLNVITKVLHSPIICIQEMKSTTCPNA